MKEWDGKNPPNLKNSNLFNTFLDVRDCSKGFTYIHLYSLHDSLTLQMRKLKHREIKDSPQVTGS